jgi:hypothetical protein
MTNTILAAINDSPLCRQIATFLMQNEAAMDTAKGIATWWLQCDQMAAQAALDRLIACGVVTVRTLSSGVLYGFTQDPEIRSLLQLSLHCEPVGPHAAT